MLTLGKIEPGTLTGPFPTKTLAARGSASWMWTCSLELETVRRALLDDSLEML
jgi:hypothetical protein